MKDIIQNTLRFPPASWADHTSYDPHWIHLRICKPVGRSAVVRRDTAVRELLREVVIEGMSSGRAAPAQLLAASNKRIEKHNMTNALHLPYAKPVQIEGALHKEFSAADFIRVREGDEAAAKYERLQALRTKLVH
jgi:hypothetical protein